MIFGFGRFLGRFFGFCNEKLRVFGFGVSYGFGFFLFLAFGFWFLAKIQAVFRLWDPMQFSVLPVRFLVFGFLNRERVPRDISHRLQTQTSSQGILSLIPQ